MSEKKSIEDYEAALPAELEALWKSWDGGALAHLAEQLKTFAAERRESILTRAGGTADPIALIAALKRMVVELGTVHHPSEMRAQMGEIHNFIWYHGESGNYNRELIATDWTTRHAGSWRRWRLKEYLFVIDRVADELVTQLKAPHS